uniref:Uncharacterized protein n=1 Tax=Romanomermis culicivorax TaxID=13658 RepID=A0A915L8Y6_ROMCU
MDLAKKYPHLPWGLLNEPFAVEALTTADEVLSALDERSSLSWMELFAPLWWTISCWTVNRHCGSRCHPLYCGTCKSQRAAHSSCCPATLNKDDRSPKAGGDCPVATSDCQEIANQGPQHLWRDFACCQR